MANKKITYYSNKKIKETNADIYILLGERSNGKSYSVKHEEGIFPFLDNRDEFIYLRRIAEEIKTDKIEQYFADVDTSRITEGECNCITQYRKHIYLTHYDVDTGKSVRRHKMGYAMALSTEQNYAGSQYPKVKNIIYDEFVSRSVYLADEPDKLMNFYCTVDRKQNRVKLWLLGNTISRVCPYFHQWGLKPIIDKMKQGDIVVTYLKTGTFDDDGNEIMKKCAIEYCKDTGRSSFTIGKHSAMMNSGKWQTDPQPQLPKSINQYKTIFRFGFQYQDFKFLCDYMYDKSNMDEVCWFIYPKNINKDFKSDTIVFSDVVKTSPYWQRNIYDISIKNDKLRQLFLTFKENNIFYASDLVGTDFKQVIDFEIRK